MVRLKNRYLVIEVNETSKKDTDSLRLRHSSLYGAIVNIIQQLHGEFGVAVTTSGFVAKYCNEKTRIAVIRCRHGPHRLVASSLPFIKHIEYKSVIVNTLYTGATIKQCYKFIMSYQQRKFDEYCKGLKTDEERQELKKGIMKLDQLANM